jgi:hypothetical protein
VWNRGAEYRSVKLCRIVLVRFLAMFRTDDALSRLGLPLSRFVRGSEYEASVMPHIREIQQSGINLA